MCLLIFEKFEIWVGGVIFKNLTSLNEILKDITICKNQSLKIYNICLIEDSLSLFGNKCILLDREYCVLFGIILQSFVIF